MSEFPQKGDRVRVVYEGRVVSSIELLGDVRVATDTGHTILTGRSANEIQILERAGYPNGTLYTNGDSTAVKTGKGWLWVETGEASVVLDDAHVRRQLAAYGGSVVHEPPNN